MTKALINLITDFGEDYRAIVKREIFKRNPEAGVIDHGKVDEYSIWKTAHILDVAYDRTAAAELEIFLCITDPGVGTAREHLVASIGGGCYFVGPNNGIITYLADKISQAGVVNLQKINREKFSNTFHGRDIFGPTAAYLSSGKSIDEVADSIDKERIVLLNARSPERTGECIKNAQVRYVDNYGDIIFNVPKTLLEGAEGVQINGTKWPLRDTYASVRVNNPVALINSTGLLELAINQGNAAAKTLLREGSIVPIKVL